MTADLTHTHTPSPPPPPQPEYPGPFTVFNEADEAGLLRRWFDHMKQASDDGLAID